MPTSFALTQKSSQHYYAVEPSVEAVEKPQTGRFLVALRKQTRSRRNASFQALQLRPRYDGRHQITRTTPARQF